MANELGGLLKKYRKKADLSQSQLVERFREARYEERYGKADISKWEHGRIPPEDVVEELEEILSTPKGLLLKAAGHASAAEYRRILAGESQSAAVERHYEDVRGAIRDWLALTQGCPPPFDPMTAGEPTHFGFGLTWRKKPRRMAAKLVIEDREFYSLLRCHLAPPVVDADFWGYVESLRKTGTRFLLMGRQLASEIIKDCLTGTSLHMVRSWQREPNVGITEEFAETISRNALWVEQCTNYAYSEITIVYLDRGIMVTQATEGVRLLQGAGLDPTFTTLYVSTAGAWVIPQGNQRLLCNGAVEPVSIMTARDVLFVLQLHSHVIAVGPLDQIRHCREVHQRLMQKYARSPDTVAVLGLREKLESRSKAISAQLEKASLHHQFPGRCPFCPQ